MYDFLSVFGMIHLPRVQPKTRQKLILFTTCNALSTLLSALVDEQVQRKNLVQGKFLHYCQASLKGFTSIQTRVGMYYRQNKFKRIHISTNSRGHVLPSRVHSSIYQEVHVLLSRKYI
ncbi:hypothetical protein ACQJBY_054553 [Aegilops geniculata]